MSILLLWRHANFGYYHLNDGNNLPLQYQNEKLKNMSASCNMPNRYVQPQPLPLN